MEILEEKREEIIGKVQKILNSNFQGYKAKIKLYKDRINFACPYCGDSHDSSKKRGNIYFKTLAFHCFNSGCPIQHTNLINFLRDHNQSVTNKEDLIFFLDYIRANQVSYDPQDYIQIGIFQNLKEYSIPLSEIKEKFKLVSPNENERIDRYLKGRFLHHKLHHFMYDVANEQLYLFNLTPDLKSTYGWQIRNFKKSKEKYVSYNIEKINLLFERKIEKPQEEIIKMNTLSLFFNITLVDFSKPVTIFEGPIDSFLCRNSIAISGIDKPTEMFDEISTIRYLFDNDSIGKKKMEQKLKKRKYVFMWEKLLKDYKIQPKLAKMESVKDFNDLLKYCWLQKISAIKNFESYFTNNPLDIRNV